jgi:hypothetical protein
MSRELPAKPSLESLRKQAKQLHRTMPQGRLSDAQHVLARGYYQPGVHSSGTSCLGVGREIKAGASEPKIEPSFSPLISAHFY